VAINVRGAGTSVNEVAEEAGKDIVSEDEAAKKAAATKADEVCLRVRERTFGELWGVSITMRTWVMHVPRVTDEAMSLVCVCLYKGDRGMD